MEYVTDSYYLALLPTVGTISVLITNSSDGSAYWFSGSDTIMQFICVVPELVEFHGDICFVNWIYFANGKRYRVRLILRLIARVK